MDERATWFPKPVCVVAEFLLLDRSLRVVNRVDPV
jgi:hypothetical protein